MKTGIVIAGIVILLVGLGLAIYGFSYAGGSNSNKITAIPMSSRSIDANGMWSFGVNAQKGETLSGTATVNSYNSSAGPIFFYIQNESTFIYWGGCAPCGLPSGGYNGFANDTIPSNGVQTFTWTAPYAGAFYLVFDNENYNQNAQATLQATANVPSSSSGMNSTVVYLGIIILVVGAGVAAAGAVMKTSKPAKPSVSTGSAPPVAPAAGTTVSK